MGAEPHAESGADRPAYLARALEAAREEFSAALAEVDPALLTTPGLVGEWSARELVAHLAYWADLGSTCLEAAAIGRLEELVTDTWDVDAQNAAVAREVAALPMSAVLDREAASYERFLGLLAETDADTLALAPPWGGTVETIVLENGPDHYAEHTEHVRAWFAGPDEADADDADDPDDPAVRLPGG